MSDPGSWISALQGQPIAVEPLADLLPRGGSAGRQSDLRVVPLFQKPSPELHQRALQAEIESARNQTVQEVQDTNQRELDSLGERFAVSIAKLENAVLGIEKVVASEVVDLALLVAGEIVKKEMSQNPELLVAAVEEALADLPHDGTVVLRLNSADLEHVRNALRDGKSVIEINPDPSLSRGDCVLETPTRIIDASIDARLAAVRESLVRLLMTEESQDVRDGSPEEEA
ncbi:MAG: hypothetical protein JKY56_17025 [Kofleriaceae bacterium]|nr:hypothetical protein [Kofleriaceae bacterium]